MNIYKGACLCGACRYVISGDKPVAMYLCHCSRCRKETGSIHGANLFFINAQLSWENGDDHFTHFKLADTRKERSFCNTCGSPLPWTDAQSQIILPAGSLDDDISLEPTAHIHCASRSSWEDKLANLPRFDDLPE